jgi:hypothetical protein
LIPVEPRLANYKNNSEFKETTTGVKRVKPVVAMTDLELGGFKPFAVET